MNFPKRPLVYFRKNALLTCIYQSAVEEVDMAENIEAINTLQAARKTLVEERRALSVAMALGYRRRRTDDVHTNGMRENFVSIQSTIEAIDRAIAHERLLETEPAEMSVVPEIVTDISTVAAG
jgi:hypothetical protein